jgi:hypothetical protein
MTAPVRADQALLDLAEATREDIDRAHLQGVLLRVQDPEEFGRPWPWVLIQTALMLAHGGQPFELLDAAHDPTKPRRAT